MGRAREIGVSGGLTFWRLSRNTDVGPLARDLADCFRRCNIPASELRVRAWTPEDAAAEALKTGAPKRTLVRPLAAEPKAWCLVREDAASSGSNDYRVLCVARLKAPVQGGDEALEFSDWAPPEAGGEGTADVEHAMLASTVNVAYRANLARADVDSIGQTLVGAANALGGQSLRPAGGLYFIPPATLGSWEGVMETLNAHRPNEAFLVRHRLDEDACRAVVAAFTETVVLRSRAIAAEVASGKLKGRALASRREELGELQAKLEAYEGILDRPLADAREALGGVRFGVATGNLLAAAGHEG